MILMVLVAMIFSMGLGYCQYSGDRQNLTPTKVPPIAKQGIRVRPAPSGNAVTVARYAIKQAGHDCGKVVTAKRLSADDSVIAKCSNGKRYSVFTIEEVGTVAMDCRAAEEFLKQQACPNL